MQLKNLKENFFNKDFFKLAIKNLILIIGIVIFVILFSAIFGKENQLIGVGLITGLLMFKNISIGLYRKEMPFIIIGICVLMGICNIFSFYNIFLAIFLNAIAIFFLMLFSTVHVHFKAYIPFILMYIFAQDCDIPKDRMFYRFLAFFISGVLLSICHYIYNKNDENCKKFSQIIKEFTLKKDNYVFTIKMTLGVTIAMFLADIIGIEKGMWICITVMSLTQPHFEATHHRIKFRILGTLTGLIIYLILFKILIPESIAIIFASFLSYVYTFVKSYYIQIIFITINSLNAAKDIFDTNYSIILRVSFVILGALIAFCIVFLEKRFLDKNVKYDDEENFD